MAEAIIAIDFGTAYSGYAVLIGESEPILPQWGRDEGLTSPKAPTCALFDENEQFMMFGFEAKRRYVQGNEIAKTTLLFENFKMELYGKKLTEDLTITAVNGKKMTALKVFTESLRYLKVHALNHINNHNAGQNLTASDFTWVLTVPAIWDASAKQFMRTAATEAGIVGKLVIALEPEAASIWCKQLPSDGFVDDKTNNSRLDQQPGTQYIVADCGGGTIDITVHQVCHGGVLKELHKASGNDMGGEQVTKNFKSCLKAIFSEDLWNEYERKFPSELQKLMYNFIVQKLVDTEVQMSMPYNLGALSGKKKPIEDYFKNGHGVTWDEGFIVISREKMKTFFDKSLTEITKSLSKIFEKHLNIDYLLLVGGFASSKILRKHIKEQFGAQCKVICPELPQQAVLKGAVMFGRNPAVVASRKSAYTYGIAVSRKFDASKHKAEKKSGEHCLGLFLRLVTIHEDVGWDETRNHILMPVSCDQTSASIAFYRTERENPQDVDDWGIDKIDSVEVGMPDTTRGLERKIELQVKFGSTEITATATDMESKTTISVKIDFFSKKE